MNFEGWLLSNYDPLLPFLIETTCCSVSYCIKSCVRGKTILSFVSETYSGLKMIFSPLLMIALGYNWVLAVGMQGEIFWRLQGNFFKLLREAYGKPFSLPPEENRKVSIPSISTKTKVISRWSPHWWQQMKMVQKPCILETGNWHLDFKALGRSRQ